MTVRSLLLCSRPPWPRIGGDRVRTWHMARSLATLGPVGVVALAGPDDDERAIRAGLPFAERLWLPRLSRPRAALRSLAALAGGWALQVALYDAPEAAAATREAIDLLQPDVVVAHLVRTVAWAPEGCPPLVADIQDALALHYARARGHGRGWRRLAMTVERGRIGRAEGEALARASLASFISEADRDAVIRAHLGHATPSVIARAVVDLEAFPAPDAPAGGDVIGFLGNLRSAPNRDMAVHFARELLPRIRRIRPAAELRIFGVEADREVRELDRLPGVRLVGRVDDVAEALGACAVTVCPQRFGSGVQNKVLESLAVGTPVVITPMAAAPLGSRVGEGLVVAEADERFAEAVAALLADPAERARLGAAGRTAIEAVHSAAAALDPLLEGISRLASKRA